jgi:hypothetical protein
MSQAPPSPKPSPDGPTTADLIREPPPVRKSVVRCLHELQSPSSPTKPHKLCRTESGIPALDLGDSVLSMPVDLKGMSVLADPKEFAEAMSQMLEQQHDKDKDPYSSASDEDKDNDKDNDKNKNKNPGTTAKGRPPLGSRNPLMRSSHKKSTKSTKSSSDIPFLLTTPPTSRKLETDATPDRKENLVSIQYGLFPMDD